MNEVAHDPVWRLNIPQERPLSQSSFRKLAERLSALHQQLVEAHGFFAHLMKIEDGEDQFRIAFYKFEKAIPHTIFVFEHQTCRIISCAERYLSSRHSEDFHEKEISDIDEGVYRLINFIRLTAQDPVLRGSPAVDRFVIMLEARPSKSSCSASPCPLHAS